MLQRKGYSRFICRRVVPPGIVVPPGTVFRKLIPGLCYIPSVISSLAVPVPVATPRRHYIVRLSRFRTIPLVFIDCYIGAAILVDTRGRGQFES